MGMTEKRRGASQAATFVVAASNSLHPGRADYVCPGADDQITIQAAIDEAKDGDKLLHQAGDYFFGDTVHQVDKSVTIEGEGHSWTDGGTAFWLSDGANCTMFDVAVTTGEHSYFPTFKNFMLHGRKTHQTAEGHGIHIINNDPDSISDAMFMNLGIAKMYGYGIFLGSGWLNSIINVWSEFNLKSGVRIDDGQAKIVNSHASYNTENGFGINSNNVLMTNCTASQNTQAGVRITNAVEGSVLGCRIYRNSYGSAGSHPGLLISSSSHINVSHNIFDCDNLQNYGIRLYSSATDITIADNDIFDYVTAGIKKSTGANVSIHHNRGFVTENSGTATLLSAGTSIVVTHGLAVTPIAGDIMVVPLETWGNMTKFWIDTYTATQFTIHADIAPGADTDFAWKAIVL